MKKTKEDQHVHLDSQHGHVRIFGVSWNIAEAKQRLSEVIRAAGKEPQIITNRDTPVAAVVSAAELEAYIELRDKHQRTLSDAIDALTKVAAEESYTLHLPPR